MFSPSLSTRFGSSSISISWSWWSAPFNGAGGWATLCEVGRLRSSSSSSGGGGGGGWDEFERSSDGSGGGDDDGSFGCGGYIKDKELSSSLRYL